MLAKLLTSKAFKTVWFVSMVVVGSCCISFSPLFLVSLAFPKALSSAGCGSVVVVVVALP